MFSRPPLAVHDAVSLSVLTIMSSLYPARVGLCPRMQPKKAIFMYVLHMRPLWEDGARICLDMKIKMCRIRLEHVVEIPNSMEKSGKKVRMPKAKRTSSARHPYCIT